MALFGQTCLYHHNKTWNVRLNVTLRGVPATTVAGEMQQILNKLDVEWPRISDK